MVASSDGVVPNGTRFNMASGNSASTDAKHGADTVKPEPIAICGIGLRLPGGVRDGDSFWELLINGRDARGEVPSTRFAVEGFDDSLSGAGALPTRNGYFLEDDLSRIDTSFFSMSKAELEWCDPQQRLLLEVVRECLDDAGEVNYRGQPVGCYVGTFGQDWYDMTMRDAQNIGGHTLMGCGDLVLANRVSYEFDLHGPSLVIKTGCSASLAALHEACRALRSGDASAAIVGGTSLILSPNTTAALFNEGVLSPDASCKTFDASANGFARAEGITAIYIKRLSDALRDGNPVRAVIRGTGSNSDGRSQGLVSPSAEAHAALMRTVYQQAGLDPRDTAFVECHGTGTAVGDPIETGAVGNVFGDEGVYIGSVKPNIGHSEGCSGISSVIKAVLALEHRTIPPNIKFSDPNPKIPFAEKRLTVPVVPTAFPKGRAERISVNSFGIGGSNAHVIIDASQPYLNNSRPAINDTNGISKAHSGPQLLLFSANSAASLTRQVDAFKQYTAEHPEHENNVAYTLALRREKLPHKTFAILQGGEFIETPIPTKKLASSPSIAMIFSGQGAQWPGMGRELILSSPSFRQDIIRMDNALQGLRIPPTWSIIDELLKPEDSSQLHRAELAQPLSTALQIALVCQFKRLGITPTAVVGHSSGEIAAAYAAGYLSLEHAITLAYYRGYVSTHGIAAQVGGMMAAVGLGAAEVARFLQPGVCVACENSPSSTTISGDGKAVQQALAAIRQEHPDVLARLLKVDMAYHSHHMAALATEYLDLLLGEDMSLRLPSGEQDQLKVPFFSSVTTKYIKDAPGLASPYYWAINLVSPVRFTSAAANLIASQTEVPGVLLEIGPHSALAGPLRQICESVGRPCNYIPSQVRGKNSSVSFLSALGRLYQESVEVDWKLLFLEGSKTLPGLPTYAWDHSSGPFWHESRLSKDWRTRRFARHCLLGSRVVETPDTAPQWRNVLNLEHVPWLSDHKVRQDTVFPFAGYIAMAGEAVRQLTGCETGYRLRHVVTRTALLLTDTDPVELVTALRQQRLSDSESSEWFEFVIASYTGSAWVKHCEGRAMPLTQALSPTLELQDDQLPRKVTKARFYDAMTRAGLVFGPEFQRLTAISSSVTEHMAAATLARTQTSQAFPGPLHPTAIDASIQLLLVANMNGLCRELRELAVPTLIEHVDVAHGAAEMHLKARGADQAMVNCVTDDGRVALRISGLQIKRLASDVDDTAPGSSAASDPHAAARLQWLPDFDFAPVHQLIKPPVREREARKLSEALALLCILESADKLDKLTPCQPHFATYRDWLQLQVATARNGDYPLVERAAEYATLSSESRRECLDATLAELLALPGNHAGALGLKRINDHAEAIFTGSRDTLDVLMQDDLLTEIYNEDTFDYGDFARSLSHTRPDLRILEVGAGTGGTTKLILDSLAAEHGLPGYAQYMFTDVSAGFFPQARARFSTAANLDFQELDLTKNALEQGFTAGSYDLILAANVVHATPCLRETLANLRPLLKPDGMLLLSEISTVARTPAYIFGNFSGWWLGAADDRMWEPHVLPERWDAELKAAGFTGADTVVRDEEMPYQLCAAILSKPKAQVVEVPDKAVTVLCQSPDDGPAASIISSLRDEGWQVAPCKLGESLPSAGQDIIACVDLETRFFDQEMLSEKTLSDFQALLRHLKDGNTSVLWLTRPYQVRCRDPRGAQALGVIRTVRNELGLPLFTLELDFEREQPHAANLIASVFQQKVRGALPRDNLNPDREFAIDNGTVLVGRYHPFPMTSALTPPTHPADTTTTTTTTTTPTAKTVHVGNPGDLSTLHWRTAPLPVTLPADAVEVKVHAAGLNFHDLLSATGTLPTVPSQKHTLGLGFEASGTITRVGTGVTRLQAGDRVAVLSAASALTTRLVLPASGPIVRLPEGMPLAAAAAVPTCFATVLQALVELGRLRKGMTVLVHSACGGVGLTALQVCRAVLGGMDGVFATVGSAEKVEYLVETWGMGRERVFGSRDGGFVEGVMRETGGKGVDLVLNSLSGELLHESWRCVGRYGTMVELGKRDLVGAGKLEMRPFLGNRGYFGLDLHRFMIDRPERMIELLEQYVDWYNLGLLQVPDPISYFDAGDVEQAFRHLQNAAHIGKVVVTMPDDDSGLEALPYSEPLTVDPEATYLLVGGSKGLGGSIASWLVEQGARDLTFLSRSAGTSPESTALFEELRAMGCAVNAVAGSVETKEDVEAAIGRSGKPVKGVFQLAMVLNDVPFLDMKWAQWNGTLGPKVRGTWNLHEALADQPLDFFWMASTLVTVVNEPGQSNYSAGCGFLEAFCQYRHSLGLPATVLNICPVDGVGFVAESPQVRWNMKAQGLYTLGEHEFLDFVRLNLLQAKESSLKGQDAILTRPWESRGQVIMGLRSGSDLHLGDPNNRTTWRRDRRVGRYHNLRSDRSDKGAVPETSPLALFLDGILNSGADHDGCAAMLNEADNIAFLARELGKKIYELILKPVEDEDAIDTRLTLAQIGMDSLMAIELRRWLRRVVGVAVSVLEIMGSGSLLELGGLVANKLAESVAK